MIQEFLDMKNWAVVGATNKEDRFGYKIVKKMVEHGYEPNLVNPTVDEVAGIKVFDSLSDIPGEIDVINMVVGPKLAKAALKEGKELGIKNVLFQPGSYDDEVLQLADELGYNHIEDCVYKQLKMKE